jgi:hypothetical protein
MQLACIMARKPWGDPDAQAAKMAVHQRQANVLSIAVELCQKNQKKYRLQLVLASKK